MAILTDFLDTKKGWIVKGENASVSFSSMIEFNANKASRLPDEPIEKGSFATYNRIIEPREITCRLAVKGDVSALQNAIDRLTDLSENDEKLSLVTPEQSYKNMMLESFEYRRDSHNGRGVLYVDLRFKEVREVATAQTTTAVDEPEAAEPIEAEDAADGSVCDDVDGGEVQATTASEAEEEAADPESNRSAARVLKDKAGEIWG